MQDAQTFAGLFHVAVLYLALAILLGMVAITSIAWLVKTVAAPMRRLLGGGIVRTALAAVMVWTGITESFSKHTNDPPRSVPSPLPDVTLEDISNGWRVAATREGGEMVGRGVLDAPQIHEPWLVRGGYGDVTRISAVGWSFPWRDGFADGLTVFSDGEIRPSLRVPYFPRPFDVPLAVVPAFNWHLLPGGISNVFWHAATPSNSLIVAWENAPVNCDASCLTNFQAEFFADGRFAYRHPDQEVEYAPVFPFDWDNDGLENSVDPDPIVAGPDAHGTNVEWYNTVCSNVLEASVELSWCEGVNSNAYYFVDIVTERGPAPIRFTGDRTSRLGDPVVVALAGETNRVLLLVGIDYAVTSAVPFAVSFPTDYMYPEVETNEPCVARIHWPLEFSVMPDGNGYRVVTAPYDPGCEFRWPMPTRSVTCGYTTSGGWIGFDCGSDGNCGCDGCSVTGSAMLEDAEFEIPSIWCGCWRDYPEDPGYGPGTPQTNGPSVSVSFDKSVVFYEDAYTNAPGDVVAKRSTKTTLSVSASAGENGGMLYVTAGNIGKLVRTGGNAITFPYAAYVPAHGGASFAIEYEAVEHSDSANDISVIASLQSAGTGTPISDSASATAVKVLLEAQTPSPLGNNIFRHKYGVREIVLCKHFPEDMMLSWTSNGIGSVLPRQGGDFSRFLCPLTDSQCQLVATSEGGEAYSPTVSIVEPTGYYCRNIVPLASALDENVAGDAGMTLELYIEPRTVCFGNIAMEEVPTETGGVAGYFLNTKFSYMWAHTRDNRAGQWCNVGNDNLFMFADEAKLVGELPPMAPDGTLTNDVSFGWQGGAIIWTIPLGWNEHGTSDDTEPTKTNSVPEQQLFTITPNGTLSVIKAGHYVSRGTNTQIRSGGVQR